MACVTFYYMCNVTLQVVVTFRYSLKTHPSFLALKQTFSVGTNIVKCFCYFAVF